MKKMLVLMLVLGLAATAQAVPTWDLTATGTTSGTITVNVTSNPGTGVYIGLAVVAADGILSSFAKGTNAPASSMLLVTMADGGQSALGQGEIWDMNHLAIPPTFTDGAWLVANWSLQSGHTSAVAGLYQFSLDDGSLIGTLDTILVPEPTTVALLGLGGLLMLRRRK